MASAPAMTDKWLKSLKPTDKKQEIRDEKGNGLIILVYPNGTKSFMWRGTIAGKQTRKPLGKFVPPTYGLHRARQEALSQSLAVPALSAAKKAPKGPQMSVEAAFDAYMKEQTGKSRDEKQRQFNLDVKPTLGDRQISDITEDDLDLLLHEKFTSSLAKGCKGIAARRLYALLNHFFKWARRNRVVTGVTKNPMAEIEQRGSENKRKRYLSEAEIKWFYEGLKECNGFAAPFDLLLRTMCRRGEIFGLTWDMVGKDKERGDYLHFPDTKNDEEHVVWLHKSALKLVGKQGKAQPTDRVFDRHEEATSKPLAKLNEFVRKKAEETGVSFTPFTLHDLRRTGRTHAARMGVEPHVCELLLNHTVGGLEGTYNLWREWPKRVAALKLWNDYLDRLRK